MKKVGIISASINTFKNEKKLSYKEILFKVTRETYEKIGIKIDQIDCFITTGEDFSEGRAIADEFVPDQIGGANRPNVRISADSISGIFIGFMQIQSGLFDIVSVVGYEKTSDVINFEKLPLYALDPVFVRPLNFHPFILAGMEMNRFMKDYKISEDLIARVVVKNKKNALFNKNAIYGEKISLKDVLDSEYLFYPLKKMEIATSIDGSVCILLASEKFAKKLSKNPVWIKGIGWCSASSSVFWEGEISKAEYIEKASRDAYKMAKISDPSKEFDFVECEDSFSYKELQHLEALGICKKEKIAKILLEGGFEIDGKIPVNPSGGSLGIGNLHSGNGLLKVAEGFFQLTGQAEKRQVKIKKGRGIITSYNGIPSRSGGVVILEI